MKGVKVSREPGPKGLGRVNQQQVKNRIEIPHNPVRLEGGLLSTEWPATEFVKAMSHELRTPLNVIIGLCQFLERDRKSPLTSTQRDTVHRMDRNARALLQTVNHLLECLRSRRFE